MNSNFKDYITTLLFIIILFILNSISLQMLQVVGREGFWFVLVLTILTNSIGMIYYTSNSRFIDLINKPFKSIGWFLLIYNILYIPFFFINPFFSIARVLQDIKTFFIFMGGINIIFDPLILLTSNFQNKNKAVKHIEGVECKPGDYRLEKNLSMVKANHNNKKNKNYVNAKNDEFGNTDIDSEQSINSKTTNSSNIKYYDQAKINDKSAVKKESIKQIGFDKKN